MRFERLPQLMKDAMAVLQELHNAPEELALQSVLGVANLAVQSHYNVDPIIYGHRPISLFLIALAETGGFKSTVYDELMVGIQRYEENQRGLLKDAEERYQLDMAFYENDMKKYKADVAKGHTGLVVPTQPTPPKTCNLRVSKTTLLGLMKILKTQPAAGLFSSEAGMFFNSSSFQQKQGDLERSIEFVGALTAAWDGKEPMESNTNDRTVKLYHRRINMLFLLQTSTIRKFLSTSAYADQGFTHRLLISQCSMHEKPLMDRSDAGVARVAALRARLEPFHQRIERLISRPIRVRESDPFEVDPIVITMDADARQLSEDYYNGNRSRDTEDLIKYKGFAQRLDEHTIRLAATLAAFEDRTVITAQDMACAIELMEYYIQQRIDLELEYDARNPALRQQADDLIAWMKKRLWTGTVNDFRRTAPCGVQKMDREQVNQIVAEMVLTGEVELVDFVNKRGQTSRRLQVTAELEA